MGSAGAAQALADAGAAGNAAGGLGPLLVTCAVMFVGAAGCGTLSLFAVQQDTSKLPLVCCMG